MIANCFRFLILQLFVFSLSAQVTIGSDFEPNKGSLLDLKETQAGTSLKGLLLPRVELTNIDNLYPMFIENSPEYSGTNKDSENQTHTGLMVFNMTQDPINCLFPGVYIWSGIQWNPVSGDGSRNNCKILTCHERDSLALVAIYNATDGPNWNWSENWLTEKPIEEWYGVQTAIETTGACIGQTRVSWLSLQSNNLKGYIPTEIGDLTSLNRLYLMNNQLTGSIPLEIGKLTKLQVADLSSNQISGNVPSELGNLTDLLYVSLTNNQLTGDLPSELGNLTNMMILGLANNKFTSIPSTLSNLQKLSTLDISTNQFDENIFSVVSQLTSLTSFRANQNLLKGKVPIEIKNLKNISQLDLSENQLTGTIPTELGELQSLMTLSLSENQLTGIIPTELEKLQSLMTLNLSGNQLTGTIPQSFDNLRSLQSIQISKNQLSGSLSDQMVTKLTSIACPQYEADGITENPTPFTWTGGPAGGGCP